MPIWIRISTAFYRLLQHAYPAEFREIYGEEMSRAFVEGCHAHKKYGGSRLVLFFVAIVSDFLQTAPAEHFDRLRQDLRYAVCTLWRSPAFTTVVVLSLALGIGANTAVFTFVDAILLQKLPVAKPDELVEITAVQKQEQPSIISFPLYRELRERQEVFTDIFASAGETPVRITVPSPNAQSAEFDNMRVGFVSGNYFPLLGVQPAIGRFFNAADDQNPNSSETAGSVVVLSDDFWERQFGRKPEVLDRTIMIGRSPCKVIGVAPRGFFGDVVGSAPVAWVPLIPFSSLNSLENRRGVFTSYMGRLRAGVSREQAQATMTVLFQQLLTGEGLVRGKIDDNTIVLKTGSAGRDYFLRRTFAKPLWIMMAIVGFILLIACANVANLLLARGASRRGEIGIRLAIGCTRRRLFQQLLTESILLSILGAAAGGGLAYWGSQALLRMIDFGPVPIQLNLAFDVRVATFLAAIAMATGIGFGLFPALQASRFDIGPILKGMLRGQSRISAKPFSRVLVICQVALSLLLLISAGLLTRSLYNLHTLDWGFRPHNVVIFDLAHNPRHTELEALAQVAQQVRQRIQQVPGVESASVSGLLLFSDSDLSMPIKIPDYTPAPEESAPWDFIGKGLTMARFNAVSAGYLVETVGMTLLDGRDIDERDGPSAPPVVVINETMARHYFGTGRAIGRIMVMAVGPMKDKPIEIVGVARDSKYNNLRQEAKPMFYAPITQFPRSLRSLEVRTSEPLAAITGPVRQALAEVSKDVMIRRVVTLSEQVDGSLAAERLLTQLSGFFGALALLLACVGLYGVMSYMIAQRTGEIGIRMALGATKGSVMWMALRETLWMVLAGVIIGILIALPSTQFLSNLLYGVTRTDPETIALAILLLVAAAALAAYVPTRRAARVDPTVALRHE